MMIKFETFMNKILTLTFIITPIVSTNCMIINIFNKK